MKHEIYQRNVDNVYRICLIYLKNTADAEDETANVFERFLNANVIFNSLDHEKAWFIRAAKNGCLNVLKSFWKVKRVDWENIPQQISNNDKQRELLEKVLKLNKRYSMVLYLYYYAGYSTLEIAQILNANENTVRTRLKRGREKLRIELEADVYYETGAISTII